MNKLKRPSLAEKTEKAESKWPRQPKNKHDNEEPVSKGLEPDADEEQFPIVKIDMATSRIHVMVTNFIEDRKTTIREGSDPCSLCV